MKSRFEPDYAENLQTHPRSASPSNIPTHPSCPSSPTKPSRSCGSKLATHTLEIYDFSRTLTFARSATDCFQVREVPAVLLCPRKRSAVLWNPPRRDMCSTSPCRPGVVSQGTRGLQARAKGTSPRIFTHPPTLTLIRNLTPPSFRPPTTVSVP